MDVKEFNAFARHIVLPFRDAEAAAGACGLGSALIYALATKMGVPCQIVRYELEDGKHYANLFGDEIYDYTYAQVDPEAEWPKRAVFRAIPQVEVLGSAHAKNFTTTALRNANLTGAFGELLTEIGRLYEAKQS